MLVLTIALAFIIAIFYEYPCHKVVNYYYKKVVLFLFIFNNFFKFLFLIFQPNLVKKPSSEELKCR